MSTSGAAGSTAFLLLGLLFGCGADSTLHVEKPSFPPSVASIFYALVTPGEAPLVHASDGSVPSVHIELAEELDPASVLYAIGDELSLEAHQLGPGRVTRATRASARSLAREHVSSRALAVENASWMTTTLPDVLEAFRFESGTPASRCVSLEKRAEYPDAEFSGTSTRAPMLLALDDERLLTVYPNDSRAAVFTATAARTFELGFVPNGRSHRGLWRGPDHTVYFGDYQGVVRRGSLGEPFVEIATLEGPAPADQLVRWRQIRALAGSRTSGAGFELFAVSYGFVFRVLPAVELLYQRGSDFSSRQRATAAWLGAMDLLFTLEDAGRTFRLRSGEVEVVLPASEIVGMDEVPGLGVFAVTSTLELLQWIEAEATFREVATGVSGRDVAIAGNAERVFMFGQEGQLDQYVPGEGLCPALGVVPRSGSSIAVFGRHLARTGPDAVEIFEMVPSR